MISTVGQNLTPASELQNFNSYRVKLTNTWHSFIKTDLLIFDMVKFETAQTFHRKQSLKTWLSRTFQPCICRVGYGGLKLGTTFIWEVKSIIFAAFLFNSWTNQTWRSKSMNFANYMVGIYFWRCKGKLCSWLVIVIYFYSTHANKIMVTGNFHTDLFGYKIKLQKISVAA